ncbi:tetratricopeptide repeat protein [Streptomyces radiopugnans]|uniref:Tetratricopeptide repeat-containing protein n=1 Tax=Streptomyces radiopugnans TaxID=403935 RepID=A0A1H9C4J6_9ACTN|nr:tetratricopeptide repeat protein [Streptomyces radiopugnans]SEP96079.1 Tetratricopeptide repeat-containing protein [Streptomyces radiopugnans]
MDSERVVHVVAERGRGSGCEILPGLVLTAAHTVEETDSWVRVRRQGAESVHTGRVVWRGMSRDAHPRDPKGWNERGVDAALIHVAGWKESPAGRRRSAPDRPRWGRIVGERDRVECRVWGFPYAEHRPGESTQVLGTINPGNGFVGGTYVVDCDTTPPSPAEGSPWRGVSGAAVFCGDLLTGVVFAELPGHRPARLEAETATALLRAEGFLDTVNRYGPPGIHVLEPVEYADFADRDHGPGLVQAPSSVIELLHPARGIVPFGGRDEDLALLREWSRRPGPGAALVHAPGGRGKTRLVLEFSRELASGEEDWAVLWLGSGSPGDIRRMPSPTVPLLVVVDGADSRVEEAAAAVEFAARNRGVPVKVVLTARSDGWWTSRRESEASLPVAALMSRTLKIPLPGLETDAETQRRSFREAALAFSSVLEHMPGWERTGEGSPSWRDLAEGLAPIEPGGHLSSPLTLHMAALVSLLDAAGSGEPSPSPVFGPGDGTAAVEEQLLAHERSHWLRVAAAHGVGRPVLSNDALLDAVVGAVVLYPRDRSQAGTLVRRVPRLSDQSEDRLGSVLSWLRAVLPSPDGRPVGDLQPDRLAERFVGGRLEEYPELADSLLPGAASDQAARFLTLTTRAAVRGILDKNHLTGWCVRHRHVLVLPAITVATGVEDPEPLLDALGAIVDDPGTPLTDLEHLAAHLPRISYNLAPWALRLHQRIVQVHREQADGSPEHRARLAVALRELAKRLGHMGRREEALRTNQEAVDLWQALPEHLPERRSELGACHNNAAMWHSALGQRREALQAARTAVGLMREEARSGDPAALDHLSRGLTSLASAESELGDHRTALRIAEECLEIRRGLCERHGQEEQFVSLLADGLHNTAVYLMECGRWKDALKAADEAVAIHNALATDNPDAFRPGLALALTTLSGAARLMGLRDRALEAAREAIAIRRELSDARPETYRADLANTLNALSIDLGELGLHGEALEAARESVKTYRELAGKHPRAHTYSLPLSLNTLANSLLSHERPDLALEAAEEAVRRFGKLTEEHPGAFRAELAMVLVTLAQGLEGVGRLEDTRDALERSASIYRSLAATAPAAFRPGLAVCLNNLSALLFRTGELETALRTVEEAIDVNTRLARGKAAAFADILNKNWLVKYRCLVGLERFGDAMTAGEKAVRGLRSLAGSAPERYEADLAMILSSTGILLQFAGQPEQALRRAKEAVEVSRRLMGRDPGRHRPLLAEHLEKHGNQLFALGRLRQSLAAAEEVLELRREVLEHQGNATTPPTQVQAQAQVQAAQAALTFGIRLLHCGRRADALPPTQEAVDGFQVLHADAPDTYAASLASALSQLAALLFHAGDGGAALETGARAVDVSRSVADPDTAASATAAASSTYGMIAAELGEGNALGLLAEAVDLCRACAEPTGPVGEIQLAQTLTYFGQRLAAVPERHPEALRASEEAVTILRRLVDAFPLLRSATATALASHGLRLAEAGRAREAADTTKEALELARLLTHQDRLAHRDALARALSAFARARLLTGDRSDLAREAAAEAVTLLERIARDEPAATEPYLREARDTYDRLRR